MNKFTFHIFLFSLIFSNFLLADGLELFVWQPTKGGPSIVLAAKNGESRKEVVQRYISRVNTDDRVTEFRESDFEDGKFEISVGKTSDLPDDSNSKKLHVAVLANELLDLIPKDERMSRVTRKFGEAGAKPFVIPPVSKILFDSEEDFNEYQNLIATKFPAMLGIGGDDLHPSIAGTHKQAGKHYHLFRDQVERSMMDTYLKEGKGVLIGLCRGYQMASTLYGHKLLQDIPEKFHTKIHSDEWHDIRLRNVKNVKNLLREWLNDQDEVNIYSDHHESVLPHKGSELVVIAVWREDGKDGLDDDTVVEALQSKDGRFVGVQFHPEYMDNKTGDAVLKGMVRHAKEFKTRGENHLP